MAFQDEYLLITNRLDSLKIKQSQKQAELHVAYEYKEELVTKILYADKQIKDKQNEYHKLLTEIQTEIARLKIAMDLEVSRLNEK